MPRFYHSLPDIDDSGKVAIERRSDDNADVYYSPSRERLERSGLYFDGADEPRVRLLSIDGSSQTVTVFPVNTFPSSVGPDSFL